MGRAAPLCPAREVRGGLALARSPDVLAKVNAPAPGKSSGEFSALIAGRPCDPRAFQRVYPDRWHQFLRAHFRSATEIACFFDVDERTARLWLEGSTAPRGWVVSFAVMAIPSAAPFLLEAA